MAKARSKSAEAQASLYKTSKRWEKNRLARLKRALKRNPENKQIEAAMATLVYRRRTPTVRAWNATKRETARLFNLFKLPKGYTIPDSLKVTSSMFSLGVRALAARARTV